MSVTVLAFFRPRVGDEAEVETTLRAMVLPSRSEPGCQTYELYREKGELRRFVIREIYHDATALQAHRDSEHYLAYRRRIASLLEGPIEVVLLDPIAAEKS